VRTKASLTKPLDHIAPICMIVSSRAWIIALLLALTIDRHIMPCLHIVICICLDMSMLLLYDIHLTIECIRYLVGDRVF
jgi:hypothetical protein